MEEGVVWAHISGGPNCDTDLEQIHWNREGSEIHTERLGTTFHQALADVGAAPEDDNLFVETTAKADLQIAGAISDMRGNVCEKPGLIGFSGSLSMTVQWQVFDPAAQQLVGRFETHATGQSTQTTQGALDALFLAAFRANARDLTSDPGFQKLLKQPLAASPGGAGSRSEATVGQPIIFPLPSGESPHSPPQAVQAVVLVLVNDGHGSGFLISPNGFILTNEHVIRSARTVRVRWADGSEGPAQVLRADRKRDIALLKADAVPAKALVLRQALPGQGEPVFAIGAPLDPSLQGTLTRGIVSANRVMDGQPFIQSDVGVTHGNSGGPLVNERGEVLGVTDLGFQDGSAVGLNMFIPIADALRALSLSPQPAATAAEPAKLTHTKTPKR